jgi:hypothetical protein
VLFTVVVKVSLLDAGVGAEKKKAMEKKKIVSLVSLACSRHGAAPTKNCFAS